MLTTSRQKYAQAREVGTQLGAKKSLNVHTLRMRSKISLAFRNFTPEEMIWCRARVTATRIMLPSLDPMLRSLIVAMSEDEALNLDPPEEIILTLERVPRGDLELAEDLLGQLANQARIEGQAQPSRLLGEIVTSISSELANRNQAMQDK